MQEWLSNKKMECKELHPFPMSYVNYFIEVIWNVLFPNLNQRVQAPDSYFEENLHEIQTTLTYILKEGTNQSNPKIIEEFLQAIPRIDEILKTDLDAIYDGDPAANSKTEIILCYPGFYAIVIYRIAHELQELGVEMLPRVLSEIAHSKTGIDIHPGATIGHHFCIDHGTGVVIGETTIIGNYVKIYQGVTLGALSLKDGHQLKGIKRHPTVLDHVTIYSEASIFGGDTIIGPNVTIGSSAFITSSVTKDNQRLPRKKKL